MLELLGNVEQIVTHAERGENLICAFFDERGARVVVLVHPVAKTHQAHTMLFVLYPLDELLNTLA